LLLQCAADGSAFRGCRNGWRLSDKGVEDLMKRITPFLWFATEAEEAANHYVSIFPNSKITSVSRYGEAGPGPKGSAMTVAFTLDGEPFVALNGQQPMPHSGAISFVVNCASQAEVDHYWERLGAGGKTQQCGWLSDKYGVPWQVVPTALPELLQDPDKARANRAMQAMLKMTKIDIGALRAAADGQ
jgi:predicted 3-demethylubiquinone-9 3-methyltransferase (glyoxalase superfamily)